MTDFPVKCSGFWVPSGQNSQLCSHFKISFKPIAKVFLCDFLPFKLVVHIPIFKINFIQTFCQSHPCVTWSYTFTHSMYIYNKVRTQNTTKQRTAKKRSSIDENGKRESFNGTHKVVFESFSIDVVLSFTRLFVCW